MHFKHKNNYSFEQIERVVMGNFMELMIWTSFPSGRYNKRDMCIYLYVYTIEMR